MSTPFRTHIRTSLANPNLQSALDANAERRITVRQQAFASLHDPQGMRQRAHTIRADVIANLDDYLAQFTANLEAHGILVQRAVDAAQAVQMILNIAQNSTLGTGRSPLIAKSKTMVSEEIGLNHALEAAGVKVVETDLGEYIVQIRNEPPAHIITPAVHLLRADVGKTFHEILGIPLTDDIPTMTAVARRILREVFLTADVGLSGVNFGVAETGTLCVVTNEGNGRMVTTLPRVHIALMGMERLVPTLDDLALMLALLPRSATGQKLSVYVNLMHAPRRPGDPDGPDERHLILVDNGRSAIRGSALEEMLYCIRCGACLNACPVFREIGGHAYVGRGGKHSSYPGPMGSVLSPALFGQAEFGHLARASSLCGACKEACPVDIDLPKLLLRVRAGQTSSRTDVSQASVRPAPNSPALLSWGLRLFTWAATSPRRYILAQHLAGLLGGLGSFLSPSHGAQDRSWLRLPALTGWGYSKDFPRPAARPFRSRFVVGEVSPLSRHASPEDQSDHASQSNPMPGTGDANKAQDIFAAEVSALGATFTRCAENELVENILSLLRERRIDSILSWSEDQLPAGLLAGLRQAGIQIVHPTYETKSADHIPHIGLTGALAGVADSGTLILPGGPGRPLTASLLPEIHIAVIQREKIYHDLPQALNLQEVREASAAVLVSGPSRTADIEMTLTIGVHGPGELHIFCY